MTGIEASVSERAVQIRSHEFHCGNPRVGGGRRSAGMTHRPRLQRFGEMVEQEAHSSDRAQILMHRQP